MSLHLGTSSCCAQQALPLQTGANTHKALRRIRISSDPSLRNMYYLCLCQEGIDLSWNGIEKSQQKQQKRRHKVSTKDVFPDFCWQKITPKPQMSIPKSIKTLQSCFPLFLSFGLCTSSVGVEIFLRNVEKRNIYGRYNHSSKIPLFSPWGSAKSILEFSATSVVR